MADWIGVDMSNRSIAPTHRRCSVAGCEASHDAKGYCRRHYQRWRSTGIPERVCGGCGIEVDGRKRFCSPTCRPRCTFDGCLRPMRTDGLCAAHYAQSLRSGRLAPVTVGAGRACAVCGASVPKTMRTPFCGLACRVANARHSGQRPKGFTCPVCEQWIQLGRGAAGKLARTDTKVCGPCAKTPAGRRLRFYGLTPAMYEAMSAAGCRICGRTDDLHIDHDHSCCIDSRRATCGKCVRGILCGSCNRAIGLFADDIGLLQAAIDYLST